VVESVRKRLYNYNRWVGAALKAEGHMRGKKKISKREFVRRFADVAEQALSKLPAEEQERKIAAFERAVSRLSGISREGNSKASRTHQTPLIPLHTRARE